MAMDLIPMESIAKREGEHHPGVGFDNSFVDGGRLVVGWTTMASKTEI